MIELNEIGSSFLNDLQSKVNLTWTDRCVSIAKNCIRNALISTSKHTDFQMTIQKWVIIEHGWLGKRDSCWIKASSIIEYVGGTAVYRSRKLNIYVFRILQLSFKPYTVWPSVGRLAPIPKSESQNIAKNFS